jgi:1A family penicillin-binding protein
MGRKSQEKQKKQKNIYTKLSFSLVNFLIFIGHIIFYPLERLADFLVVTRQGADSLLGSVYNFKLNTSEVIVHVKKTYKNIAKSIINFKTILFLLTHKPKPKKRGRPAKLTAQPVTNKKNMKIGPSTFKRRFKLAFAFFWGMVFTFLFILVPSYSYSWYKQLPQPELLEYQGKNSATKILDRKGRLLYEIYVDKKYDPVPLSKIPDHVINATLAIEDKNFYSHRGFNVISIARAAKATLVDDEIQGGSTVTQQLVKNVLLTSERTLSRKARELVLSVLVERRYTKNEILELYLNNIPYGGTAYGIQTASQKYFNKDVWDLDMAEASMLAGLPSAPTVYSPVQGNYELAKHRQKQVLLRMVELGYITQPEADEAFEQQLVFAPQIEYIRAPHFVTYVRDELYRKYGQRAVDFGGLTVTTTLDLDVQEVVQKIVAEEVANSEYLKISNGAAIVLDSRSGGVLAYVGSVDYFSDEDGNFDVVRAYRQPGSSIKPVTYAAALEKGYTAATILDDSPVTYQSYGQVYSPRNYDNRFRGRVTLRQALGNSLNIPAVKMLNAIGVDSMVQLGIDMGLNNWRVGDGTYGLAVTLGGKETRLIDLTNLYATFARGGVQKQVNPFISIKDIYGFELYQLQTDFGQQVIKPETAYIINNILADNSARAAAFGPNSQLVIPGKTVAVKTGTTNDIRDNLTLGYTPTYTVGVWVGNNDNTPMSNVASGLSGASTMWQRIMLLMLEGKQDEPFLVPGGIIVKTDPSCGRVEVFDDANPVPEILCPVKKDDDKDKDKDKDKDENNRDNNNRRR